MTITVDSEELRRVNEVRKEFTELTFEYGKLQLTKRQLQKELNKIEGQFEKLLTTEESLMRQLNDRYGVGNLNVETGEFTPTATKNVDGE